ncbi:Abi-like protein [Desulfosporosinus orientis DSM 765]|uniref:Abi-like protein n=1 Tax=Desulfosporosinus orientis (strain ATCC 19365 / DSM 765 / NCIMB 8382 / VKM B-1628 / Singapore I) TaxID=768706 RepID=G7WI43_DESOD|nr:Abi family protein [Desulfosporosinus orientis]AET70966.1 Abi-like protein [Desulfosporosinus orientis DSM 765]
MSRVKSTDSLMKYLRDHHNITISGSIHKRKLRNIGYYHGFKGYRFINRPNNRIVYTNFNEVLAINTFDMQLKSLFYPQIMFIETALKNYVLETILIHSKTDSFNIIYDTLLTDYKTHTIGSPKYKNALNKRLKLRNQFYNVLTREFSNDKQIVQHFYHKDEPVPIWAVFEVISLGEFGNFVSCSDTCIKRDISLALGLNQAFDSNGKLTQNIIYLIKDLRNSIAHNDVIFDTRFKSFNPNNSLLRWLSFDTNIQNITFQTIVDYLILIIYLQKNLKTSKTDLTKIVNRFELLINQFRSQIPINIYTRIVHTNTRGKLNSLKAFIKI